jgi:hypothetical protein
MIGTHLRVWFVTFSIVHLQMYRTTPCGFDQKVCKGSTAYGHSQKQASLMLEARREC